MKSTVFAPGPIFHARCLDSWISAPDQKVSVGNISPGAFWRRGVRYWQPLGCGATELEKPPQGCVIYTVVYSNWRSWKKQRELLLQLERGLNRNTCIWYVEEWELKLYFYPSARGLKKTKKKRDHVSIIGVILHTKAPPLSLGCRLLVRRMVM